MGAIKDVVDLVTQLVNRVDDRKAAADLSRVQSLIGQIQSDHATLHETNIELRKQQLADQQRIQELEARIAEVSSGRSTDPDDSLLCPNCANRGQRVYMSPYGAIMRQQFGTTHFCSECGYKRGV